jgi:hypothetical protein
MASMTEREKRMRVTFLTATALAAIFATAASAADEYPPRKPGLWEVTVHNPAIPDVTTKMCLDAETDQLFHKFSDSIRTHHCAKHDVKFTGDTVQSDTSCTAGGTTVTTSSTTKFSGDSAYHVDINIHFDPPKLGHSDMSTSQDGKWVGDCPADMKPGDLMLPHGIKINIKTVNMFKSLLPGHSSQ